MSTFGIDYAGAPLSLPRVELPAGGWVDVDVAWLAADNSRISIDDLFVSPETVLIERLSDRRWRLHSTGGTHRLTIYGVLGEVTHHVADLVIAGRRRSA